MSTKTLRKRIALVAVSALGFGLVSVAPVNAAATVASSLTISKGSIVAGVESVTVTAVGVVATPDLGVSIRVVTPSGTKLYGYGGAAGTDSTGITNTTLATASATFTLAASALLDPGTYTITSATGALAADVDTAAEVDTNIATAANETKSVTLTVVSPATSTAMGISMNASSYAAGAQPIVRSWRPTNGVAGTIKFRVDRSADVTPTLGAVFAATTGGTGNFATYTLDAGDDDTAGTYVYSSWVDTNANGLIDGAEPSASVTFTVSGAAGAVTASLNKTSFTDAVAYDDFTFTATVTDALGRPVSGETVNVSECSSAGADVDTSFTDIADNTAMTNVAGTNSYYINGTIDTAATADTNTVYLCAFIGADVAAGVTAELVSIKSLTVNAVADLVADGTTSMAMSTGAGIGSFSATTGLQQDLVGDDGTDIAATVDPSVTSITYTGTALAADAGEAIVVTVTPKNGTTAVAGSWAIARVLADQSFSYTVAATFADTNGYTISFVGAATNVSAVVTFAAAAPQWSTSPAASWTALNGSTNTITGTLSDQYGRPMASKQVIATVTGRNPGTTVLTTNAAGQATWTGTDVSTSTVLLTDSVQFTYNDVDADAAARATSSTARVITYAATLAAVGTVTVVTSSDLTEIIDQVGSAATTAANLAAYTATVKTAAGAPVGSGVLVTFAGGADDIFYGASSGVTTSTSNGQVTVYVYRHKVGYSTITATANGTASAAHTTVNWSNTAAAARNITVTAAQKVTAGSTGTIIATLTDRWGNPIEVATGVTMTISGVGRLQTGSTAGAANTDAVGQRQIQVTSNDTETGVMTITASHAGTQGLNPAGYVGTAAVAGVTAGNQIATTTVTFEKSTATSTADALLALATALGTREQAAAAVDAAAEATDAANAATDAANAAAEAADAATAAAQDAADAVAALSTQVSEMVAALKKQITSLTNLVIKIQKKVKA